jgi:hypothetical protein
MLSCMELPDEEPLFAPWRPRRIDDVPGEITPRRPALLAVDGRGGSGKSTVAGWIAELVVADRPSRG